MVAPAGTVAAGEDVALVKSVFFLTVGRRRGAMGETIGDPKWAPSDYFYGAGGTFPRRFLDSETILVNARMTTATPAAVPPAVTATLQVTYPYIPAGASATLSPDSWPLG